MDNLIIEEERDVFFIPSVKFDASTGVCEIAGESYLEDTVNFYKKLLSWLKEYKDLKKPLTFNFKLTYFNTSSSKGILDIMKLLKEFQNGTGATVSWHYPEDDEDNLEEAEDFIADTGLKMNLISY